MKPKFKVGDRVFRKDYPVFVGIITGIKTIGGNCLYEINSFEYGQKSELSVELDIEWMDKHYTLDLNHYIQNL